MPLQLLAGPSAAKWHSYLLKTNGRTEANIKKFPHSNTLVLLWFWSSHDVNCTTSNPLLGIVYSLCCTFSHAHQVVERAHARERVILPSSPVVAISIWPPALPIRTRACMERLTHRGTWFWFAIRCARARSLFAYHDYTDAFYSSEGRRKFRLSGIITSAASVDITHLRYTHKYVLARTSYQL